MLCMRRTWQKPASSRMGRQALQPALWGTSGSCSRAGGARAACLLHLELSLHRRLMQRVQQAAESRPVCLPRLRQHLMRAVLAGQQQTTVVCKTLLTSVQMTNP